MGQGYVIPSQDRDYILRNKANYLQKKKSAIYFLTKKY